MCSWVRGAGSTASRQEKEALDWREELVVIRSTGIPWPRACPSTAFSRRPMPRETERLAKRPTETELW